MDAIKTSLSSIVATLENGDFRPVVLQERRGATLLAIGEWERENYPYELPLDLKSFLEESDGVLIRWHATIHGQKREMGCLHVNPLCKIQRLRGHIERDFPGHWDNFADEPGSNTSSKDSDEPRPALFDLDAACIDGRVALVYLPDEPSKPRIYYQDLSCAWHYITDSFSKYWQLLILHCGVLHWQTAYTPTGLDPVTKEWLGYIAPGRLEVDMMAHEERQRAMIEPQQHPS